MADEKNFENLVKAYLKLKGVWFIKYWAGSRYTRAGIPDLLCCVNGYFLAIELKARNGKVSDSQIEEIEKIRNSNGIAIVLYPSQFEEFKLMIERLKRCKNERCSNDNIYNLFDINNTINFRRKKR